jgi:hypothetical protein
MDQVQSLALEVKNLSSLTAGKRFEVDKGYVAPKGKDVNPEPVAKSSLDGFANYLSTIKK